MDLVILQFGSNYSKIEVDVCLGSYEKYRWRIGLLAGILQNRHVPDQRVIPFKLPKILYGTSTTSLIYTGKTVLTDTYEHHSVFMEPPSHNR